MSEASFKVGDSVKHKSGGPVMTVSGVEATLVQCEWWAGTGFQTKAFVPDTLVKVEPSSGTRKVVRG